jgi:hypothetical protein
MVSAWTTPVNPLDLLDPERALERAFDDWVRAWVDRW